MVNAERLTRYGPPVVRWGAGIIFLLLGIWQLAQPQTWFGYLPAGLPIDASTAILLNGIADAIIGLLLLVGFLTRVAAVLGALHLGGIIVTLGVNDIAVRDLGLAIIMIGIALHGPDELSLDNRVRKSS